jgi:hypothetical protein
MRRESNKRHSKLAYPSIVVQDDLVDNAMMKTPVAYGVAVWPRGIQKTQSTICNNLLQGYDHEKKYADKLMPFFTGGAR